MDSQNFLMNLNKKYKLEGGFPLGTGFLDLPYLCDELSSLYNTWKMYGISRYHKNAPPTLWPNIL